MSQSSGPCQLDKRTRKATEKILHLICSFLPTHGAVSSTSGMDLPPASYRNDDGDTAPWPITVHQGSRAATQGPPGSGSEVPVIFFEKLGRVRRSEALCTVTALPRQNHHCVGSPDRRKQRMVVTRTRLRNCSMAEALKSRLIGYPDCTMFQIMTACSFWTGLL